MRRTTLYFRSAQGSFNLSCRSLAKRSNDLRRNDNLIRLDFVSSATFVLFVEVSFHWVGFV